MIDSTEGEIVSPEKRNRVLGETFLNLFLERQDASDSSTCTAIDGRKLINVVHLKQRHASSALFLLLSQGG